MSFTIASINIEGDRHTDRVLAFIERHRPKVVFLQEAFADDLSRFAEAIDSTHHFVPMVKMEQETKYGFSLRGLFGIGCLIHKSVVVRRVSTTYYRPSGVAAPTIPVFTEPNSPMRALFVLECEIDGIPYTLATTHFTWSPGGQPIDEQFEDLRALLALTNQYKNMILCGDFNAPRGGEVYKEIIAQGGFVDTISPQVTTTLDHQLHYAGKLDYVVDYFFYKGNYEVKETKVICGVSDHCAVLGEVA